MHFVSTLITVFAFDVKCYGRPTYFPRTNPEVVCLSPVLEAQEKQLQPPVAVPFQFVSKGELIHTDIIY